MSIQAYEIYGVLRIYKCVIEVENRSRGFRMKNILSRFKDAARGSGDLFLPQSIRRFLYSYIIGSESSMFYISRWSILHMISGCIIGYALLYNKSNAFYYFTGLFIHTIWEIWQKFIGMTEWDLRGAIDTAVDTIMCLIGMALVRLLIPR
jgi:hypothetical protein